jgi:hypothetical protein
MRERKERKNEREKKKERMRERKERKNEREKRKLV